MLEMLAYKKYKKHKLEKQLREQNAKEALSKQDEQFIRQIVDNESPSPRDGKESILKFLYKRKPKDSAPTTEATPQERVALPVEDEGLSHLTRELNVGVKTPNSQESELSKILSSLHLVIDKVTPLLI